MKSYTKAFLLISLGLLTACRQGKSEAKANTPIDTANLYREEYRPQFHFTPEEKWMNDPNGLVYHKGVYHLFYQYYPGDIVWGPMHWGHAVSRDLIHWEHKPIALYPDEHGYIFSGSAVVDVHNSSGLGSEENPPLVAIYTYHNSDMEKEGRTDYQTQGIAYSLDNGESWEKYSGNPVIPNKDGIKDFRDPKVFWNEGDKKWIMVLVAGDHAQFYSSRDLLQWEYMSSFGKERGAHGGVWECPDLFPLKVEGQEGEKWVLIISINPGAPNGGSGTQYFVGDFDGTQFTSTQEEEKWIDWGPDNYAGVTYNNVPGGDRIFIGWMSNWDYAMKTPTQSWRSAMTLPRKLSLLPAGEGYLLANAPIEEFRKLTAPKMNEDFNLAAGDSREFPLENLSQSQLEFKASARDLALAYVNEAGDTLDLTLQGADNQFVLNRTKSGQTGFSPGFAQNPLTMPVDFLPGENVGWRVIMDWSSVEIFLNDGQYVFTSQVFPNQHYNKLIIKNRGEDPLQINGFELSSVKSIWD